MPDDNTPTSCRAPRVPHARGPVSRTLRGDGARAPAEEEGFG